MKTLERPPTATRIKAARQCAGLSQERIAESLGLTPMSYHDLEVHDDEAFMCISLAQLATLATILGGSARSLVSNESALAVERTISMGELVRQIRERMAKDQVSIDAFGEQVGWDVANILDRPDRAWDEWCVDTLRAVCARLGVEWRAVVPE